MNGRATYVPVPQRKTGDGSPRDDMHLPGCCKALGIGFGRECVCQPPTGYSVATSRINNSYRIILSGQSLQLSSRAHPLHSTR